MIRFICYHQKYKKQCVKLKKSGAQAAKAVDNAQGILAGFKKHRSGYMNTGTLTGKGELRLENCLKYRLGDGYRLILQVVGESLNVLFIGSHDQSHKWLEKNKGFTDFMFGECEKIVGDIYRNQVNQNRTPAVDKTQTVERIDEKYLRVIFKGICSRSISHEKVGHASLKH